MIWLLMMVGIHSDEYCPHCDNHFVIDAKTPKPGLKLEGEDARKDARFDCPANPGHGLN